MVQEDLSCVYGCCRSPCSRCGLVRAGDHADKETFFESQASSPYWRRGGVPVSGLLMVNGNGDRAGRRDEAADLVAQGRCAIDAGDWESASAVFKSALARDESPAALDGYGLAVW